MSIDFPSRATVSLVYTWQPGLLYLSGCMRQTHIIISVFLIRLTIGRRHSQKLLWHALLFLPVCSAYQLVNNKVLQRDKSQTHTHTLPYDITLPCVFSSIICLNHTNSHTAKTSLSLLIPWSLSLNLTWSRGPPALSQPSPFTSWLLLLKIRL